MRSFESMVAQLPAAVVQELRLDVSELTGQAPETDVFLYRDPEIAAVFIAARDSETLRKAHPGWPPEMAMVVAAMAAAHVEPACAKKAAGEVYAAMAEDPNAKPLFGYLMARFVEGFPHLINGKAAGKEKKRNGRAAKTPPPA